MIIEITPPVDRTVTISMTEHEGKILERIMKYNLTIPSSICTLNSERCGITEFMSKLGRALRDAGVQHESS